MDVKTLLLQNRSAIVRAWNRLILDTYPEETSHFLKGEKDSFTNPVGSALIRQTEGLFDGLVADVPIEGLAGHLDGFVRIRAVQDFCPSDAVGYIFLLKQAIRDALHKEMGSENLLQELLNFESRIDRLALLAFDLYTECRKTISEIRVGEARAETERVKRVLRAMNRTNVVMSEK